MRSRTIVFCFLCIVLVGACDLWPKRLESLANSIERNVSGEVSAWRVGENVVVINIANSPLYSEGRTELETAATGIAAQAITASEVPLESISVTFHEGEVSEETGKIREFVFLVKKNKAILQPLLSDDATGPLTLHEVQALFVSSDASLSEEREKCVLREIESRAHAAGDPETLDPATVEFLPVERWRHLDRFGKRLILAQVISTRAFFVCGESGEQGRE